MQSFYTIPHLAKQFGITEQSVAESMAALGQEPVMLLDDKPVYSLESASLLQVEIARWEEWFQKLKAFAYRDLNSVLYPDGSGSCNHFPPLEDFLETYRDAPDRDGAPDYWAEVENYRQHLEIDRAVQGLPEQAERMLKYLWRKKRDLGTGRKIVPSEEFQRELAAFDFSPYAEIIAKLGLSVE